MDDDMKLVQVSIHNFCDLHDASCDFSKRV